MNALVLFNRIKSNDFLSTTFVGCRGVACRAQPFGSPRCSRGWSNGTMQMRTWSSRQDHTQTALSGLTSPGTCLGLGLVWSFLTRTRSHTRRVFGMATPAPRGGTSWRGESLHSVCEWIQIHNIIQYASKFSITKMMAADFSAYLTRVDHGSPMT